MLGYNVQTAVDAKHHVVLRHEGTNQGTDWAQLGSMCMQIHDAIGTEKLIVLAVRGYYAGRGILKREQA